MTWIAILVFLGAYGAFAYHKGAISAADKHLKVASGLQAQLATANEQYRAQSAQIVTLGEKTREAKARAIKLQAEAKTANLKLTGRTKSIYSFKTTGDQCLDAENLINQELQK